MFIRGLQTRNFRKKSCFYSFGCFYFVFIKNKLGLNAISEESHMACEYLIATFTQQDITNENWR